MESLIQRGLIKKKLIEDLQRLPQFKLGKYDCGQCRSFYMRWRIDSPQYFFIVEFGQKKVFDRWANSCNFSVFLNYSKDKYRCDIVQAHKWMEKVCRSGLFNFNSYFNTIVSPFFAIINK
jgi:hypothetical protein